MNPKTQLKIIVTCYFESIDKAFKALKDTGSDKTLLLKTTLNLSKGETLRKASAIKQMA
jgi:hypothetical protein